MLPHVDLLETMCKISLSPASCTFSPKLQTVHVGPRLASGRPELHEGSAVSFHTNAARKTAHGAVTKYVMMITTLVW